MDHGEAKVSRSGAWIQSWWGFWSRGRSRSGRRLNWGNDSLLCLFLLVFDADLGFLVGTATRFGASRWMGLGARGNKFSVRA